ncbi:MULTISPECIES: TetR/AcrR family transcriptional regulator [unclassified Paenibacillus]|uniref:TetR/AcrR family transcriptional regulator n=1 Tax=unclassified Paenibacillus TaxID=185978 RepID=UPI0009573141|nr:MULTISPECIES: TetR/AcrR family transcriptional regulator [unclassified Paenibacillus]ASS67552.1 TetR/AcrR family transcriptional regulator [Paenibacillus sp. RUD330]SIQ73042.1 transcriptional regulator, TetR family [Paenibacillus sp. RU4X]SIQ94466.1 transcriptional regulator, TetR family [Paenibacillus sp. RU4T]
MNKKQQQTEQTKKKIAEAARTLFIQKGYKATSIDEIVKATGCSAGNIYYHFKNKEGLILHLLDEWNQEWEETWLAQEHRYETAIEKLYGMAEHLALDQWNHPLAKAVDEFFNLSDKTSDVEERMSEIVQGYLLFNRQLLQKGIDSGEFAVADVDAAAMILDSLLYGLSQHTRRMRRDEALAAYRTAMEMLLHGIAKAAR